MDSMSSMQIIPIKSNKIIEKNDDLLSILLESVKRERHSFEHNDILVIASKVVSYTENRIIDFSSIQPSKLAKKLAEKAKIPPEFAQIIFNESDYNYIGCVPGAITTITRYGLLANAGSDQSNIGVNQAILLPENCKKSAEGIHNNLLEITGKYVGIIIADSRTIPMRLGTVGCALATYGFLSVIDERGKLDLYGKQMTITTRAIADQLATAAESLMGETNEQIPFVIIRGYPMIQISSSEERDLNSLISAEDCMFIGPILPCIKEIQHGDNEID